MEKVPLFLYQNEATPGGVATGLAVGAGVMAAQAIGRNLMGDHGTTPAPAGESDRLANNNFEPVNRNANMGGEGFGINDTSSWDDGASVDASGSDWDDNS